MKPFLKRDVRSAIFVCLSTGISAGIDIYKIRKKEEQER